MTHSTSKEEPAYSLDELYAAYCEFKNDATRGLLSDEPDEKAREDLIRLNQPMNKHEFSVRLKILSKNQDQFERFKRLLKEGWKEEQKQPLPSFLQKNRFRQVE